MTARLLAVIDHDCPGTEDMHDPLYFCVGLRAQFSRLDLVLRGQAVTSALVPADGSAPQKDDGAQPSNPQRYVRSLLRAGVRVWVDDADLAELQRADQILIDGARTADTDAMAARWHEYQEVWFL